MTETSTHVQSNGPRRPRVYQLYESPMSGDAIEACSMAAIDREVPDHGYAPDEWTIIQRMIHTTADFGLLESVRFSARAIESGKEALRAGRTIFVDSNMIKSGVSVARLRKACPHYGPEHVICHVADRDIATFASESGLPRSLFAVRKAASALHNGIAVFGNAPVALLELNRLIVEEGIRPALVIGMPVGFVHVVESKEELMTLDVPYIVVEGRRGGSTLAVSTIHALCSLATRFTEKSRD